VDGSWRVLEAIGKRFYAASAEGGFVLNSRDITERKRAEAAVRQANQTLQAVIEMSPLAIYSTDLHGIVRHWNTAAERVLGYSASEVLNQALPNIFPDTADVQIPAEASATGHMLPTYEGPGRRKDGSTAEVSVWETNLRDATGAITGVVAIVADNTERKKLEEQFRQSQKMEAVGRLAGGIAHDFNNLLTVITGYCQMLVDSLADDDPVRGDMAQVLKAADRATTLTKQLLAFSRQQIVQPKVIDVNHLISEMEHILRRLVGEDVELIFQRTAEPLKVRVDPGQLEQVIVNLAVNARDAMPRGGRLTLNTTSIDVPDEPDRRTGPLLPGTHVLLRVSDTGVGMDPVTKSHLFEPFFTTKEKGRGTGLGLSTSYGIIKQNQGEIEVASEPGSGTSFLIYLPRVYEPVSPEVPREQPRQSRGGSETIMVVEDEDGVRKVVVEMLQQQGYNVLPANSGPAALELYASATDSVHLLITDVVMPRMSGRELADSLREARPDLKVLFVSGYTDSAIVHHGVLDSGTHFLQKPFTPDVLAEKVRSLLES
jgi:PAS domain S-box-containing protein